MPDLNPEEGEKELALQALQLHPLSKSPQARWTLEPPAGLWRRGTQKDGGRGMSQSGKGFFLTLNTGSYKHNAEKASDPHRPVSLGVTDSSTLQPRN